MEKIQEEFNRKINKLTIVIGEVHTIIEDLRNAPWSSRKGAFLHCKTDEMLTLCSRLRDLSDKLPLRESDRSYYLIEKSEKLYRKLKNPMYDKFIKREELPILKKDFMQLRIFKEEDFYRKEKLIRLETDLIDIVEVFKDMETLLDTQQEDIDITEKSVSSANQHVALGDKELDTAETYYKQLIKNKGILCLLGGVVGAMVGVPASAIFCTKAYVTSSIGLGVGSSVTFFIGNSLA